MAVEARPVPALKVERISIRSVFARAPVHFALIGLALLWSVPTIALLVSSFRDPGDVVTSGWWNLITHPLDVTLDNYRDVLSQRGMDRAFVNSLLITIPSTGLVVLIASMAAYAFAWMHFPGRNLLFLIMVGTLVVPLQMTLIPVLRLYTDLTIDADMPLIGGRVFGTSSYIGIWLAHTGYGLPFAIYLLRNFFGSLPRDLFESAYLDGATDTQVFFRIVLPLSMPAIAALGIFQFLWVWNDFLIALVFLGKSPDQVVLTIRLNDLLGSRGESWEILTASAFVSIAVPVLVFFSLQRFFVRGLLSGSVK